MIDHTGLGVAERRAGAITGRPACAIPPEVIRRATTRPSCSIPNGNNIEAVCRGG